MDGGQVGGNGPGPSDVRDVGDVDTTKVIAVGVHLPFLKPFHANHSRKAILAMNTPGQARETIPRLGEELQLVQKTKAGWQLGIDLLHSEHGQVRHFGANTLIVKMNNDW
jgi:hypothetical protein